jgi:hypothetical protein
MMRTRDRGWVRLVLAAFLFAGALRFAILPWVQPVSAPVVGIQPQDDFQKAIYYPVRAWLDGGNPYDRDWYLRTYPVEAPFLLYLPSLIALHLPFGLPPIEEANLWYFAYILALTVLLAAAVLTLSAVRPRVADVLMVSALIMLSRPGRQNLLLGQVALQAVLPSYLALCTARSRPLVSGLGLGLSMFKPTFGGPLGVLMLARGDRRAVAAGAGFTLLLNGPLFATLVHRAGGVGAFARDLGGTATDSFGSLMWTNPALSIYRIDLISVVSRLVGSPLPKAGELVVLAGVLGAASFVLHRLRTTETEHRAVSNTIICLAALLCIYHQAYDILLLTLPLTTLVYGRLPSALLRPYFRRVMTALLFLLAGNYFSSGSLLVHLHLVEDAGQRFGTPSAGALVLASLNGIVLLVLFVGFCWAALRHAGWGRPRGAYA